MKIKDGLQEERRLRLLGNYVLKKINRRLAIFLSSYRHALKQEARQPITQYKLAQVEYIYLVPKCMSYCVFFVN